MKRKAVILAAGKGTRMKSDLPKVVHRIDGKCLVDYVIEAARGAGVSDVCLVVGYKHDVVEREIAAKDVEFVLQPEQLGTGHAVKCAREFLCKRAGAGIPRDQFRHVSVRHRTAQGGAGSDPPEQRAG